MTHTHDATDCHAPAPADDTPPADWPTWDVAPPGCAALPVQAPDAASAATGLVQFFVARYGEAGRPPYPEAACRVVPSGRRPVCRFGGAGPAVSG